MKAKMIPTILKRENKNLPNKPLQLKYRQAWKKNGRIQMMFNTFCKLSLLLNGECKGELLLVYVRGLLISDGKPSLLDSVLHFRWWLREINAFNPLNHTSASSLSLQIYNKRIRSQYSIKVNHKEYHSNAHDVYNICDYILTSKVSI